MFVIMSMSDPKDHRVIGPFETHQEALDYSFNGVDNQDGWWILDLESPVSVAEPPKSSNIFDALERLTDAGSEVFTNAYDRNEVLVDSDSEHEYEECDTFCEEDGEHYYPEWLELKRALSQAREALKSPSKSMYLVVVDHLLEHGYYPCSTTEEVEQVKQNYMSSETEVYRCELVEANGVFLG